MNNKLTVRCIAHNADTALWLKAVAGQPYPAILESSLFNKKQGRFSILCWAPFKKVSLQTGNVTVSDFRTDEKHVKSGDPFAILSEEFEKEKTEYQENFPLPFAGGAIGYLSYDLRHYIESLQKICEYDVPVPEFTFCFYDHAVITDHAHNVTYWVGSEKKYDQLKKLKKADKLKKTALKKLEDIQWNTNLKSNFTPDEYKKALQRVIDYIAAGDIFQANLSQRFEGICEAGGLDIYRRLRHINPAPFSAYLRYPKFEIISSSPERFLLLQDDIVSTRPIKGTRPRIEGNNKFNEKMKSELVASAKDNSELAMIVDLERNDLGRVCSYGSVNVDEHAALETYPTVFHLVSTISGRLHRPHYNEFDLLKATFPGGSITGAPKIRAMEILEELEPAARNIYTGSAGYISFHGRMDMNILIRTILKVENRIYMQFGGGIVADSDPEAEYQETLDKGKALFDTIGAHIL